MKIILYLTQNYSFEILRPIQHAAFIKGYSCLWLSGSSDVDVAQFKSDENWTESFQQAREWCPDAVISPGNNVPEFVRGLKVQVFHGLEWKKKGHFKIRDHFDLYCTQGPITTNKFNELAALHKNFIVRETGWSKLDPLFLSESRPKNKTKVILYAPTFSEKLTSVVDCFDEIKRISELKDWKWLAKFHPLMNKDIIAKYQALQSDQFQVVDDHSILPLLKSADVMLSDTSSVIGEFLLLNKPVVTYRNSLPSSALINIHEPGSLESALVSAFEGRDDLREAINNHNDSLHPYTDGQSSLRILNCIEDIVVNKIKPPKKRPINLFRRLKFRKSVGYWRP